LGWNYAYILVSVYYYSAVASIVFKLKVEMFCDSGRNRRPDEKVVVLTLGSYNKNS
jgi:hypothetical protein